MIIETPLLPLLDLQYFDDVTGWQSVLADVTRMGITRGGSPGGVSIKTDVGILSATFYGAHDPLEGGKLVAGVKFRAVVRPMTGETEPEPIFTGKLLDVLATYPLNKDTGEIQTFVEVTAVDAVQGHTQTNRKGVSGSTISTETGSPIWHNQTTYEERIAALAPSSLTEVVVPQSRPWRVTYAL